ncbi:hypothetical protein PHMEG_00036839, partial [Phytophthora megakarya]
PCYTQLAGRTIHVYTRFSTLEWVHTSKSLFGRTTQFAVMLSPWHLVVTRVKEKDCSFAQLLQAGLTSFVDLEDSLATVTPPTHQGIFHRPHGPPAALCSVTFGYPEPTSLVRRIGQTEKYGGYGSFSWIVWQLPDWILVTAASAYLEATTVNMAEYSGMNNGVQAALDIGATDLVIVGDSRLAIQQSLGVIALLHKRKFGRDICDTWNRHSDPELPRSRIENISSILLQAKSKPKRVIFADETSVTGGEDVAPREEANGVPTEDSGHQETELSRVTALNGNTPALPDAEDVDP